MTAAVAALLWCAAGYRLLILFRTRTLLNTMYCLSFAAAAAALTAKVFESSIDAAAGPYVGDLVKHLLVVAMGAFIQLFILAVEVRHPTRRAVAIRVGVAVLVAGGMIAAFLAAPIHDAVEVNDLDVAYLQLAPVRAYLLLFNGYLTYVLVDNIRLYRRFAAVPGDDGRSTNLRLVGWGSAIGLVYTATRLISMFWVMLTGRPLTVLESIGSIAAIVGFASVALAVFSPRVVPWCKDWYAARAGTRRLNALWRDLTTAYPSVVLPTAGASIGPRRAEFLFDRRLVETSECLSLVRLPDQTAAEVAESPHPIQTVAAALRRERASWLTAPGPTPAELLPVTHTQADEARTVLSLATEYAALSRTTPTRESSRS